MAEVDDIFNEITAEATTESVLDGLDASGDTATQLKQDINNGSNVGLNRTIAYLIAYAMQAQRSLFRLFKIDVQNLALDGHFGTKRWFVAKALQFQYGYNLTFTDKDAFYPIIDEAAKIVSHAAVSESAYHVIVKVAKTQNNALIKLSTDERLAVQDYFDELRPPINVTVRSANSDKARIIGQVVTDAKQGIPNIQINVEQAIFNYLQTLDFNGVFSLNKLRQTILSVTGVIDVVFDDVAIRIDGNPVWNPVNRIYRSFAGFINLDANYQLSDTLTYLSSNV